MSQSRSKKSGPKVRTISQAAKSDKKYKDAKDLSDASKRRTPGWNTGGEQDRLSRRIYAGAAAREMIKASKKKK